MTEPVPILVVSCDAYADLWPAFFHLFLKHWSDCPYPIYLGSNFLEYSSPGIKTLPIGKDLSWSENVQKMLDRTNTDYVILFLEDFLLLKKVDNKTITRVVEYCISNRIDCCRLAPLSTSSPLPEHGLESLPELAQVVPNTPYRVSAQIAIWKVSTLRKYLVPGFSAWDFEHVGTQMSRFENDLFLGPFKPFIEYDHGVEKGKWKLKGISICKDAGFEIDLKTRSAFSREELECHYAKAEPGAKLAKIKADAMEEFESGRTLSGLKLSVRYLLRKPLSPDILGVIAFGVFGSRSLNWLRRQHLKVKLLNVRHKPEG